MPHDEITDTSQTVAAGQRHTPGPWFLEGNWEPKSGKPMGGWVSCFPPSGVPVFGLEPSVGTADEIAANAFLIAAAPDLLMALKGLLADIEDYQRVNNLGGEDNHSQVIARAAIAKAEGVPSSTST